MSYYNLLKLTTIFTGISCFIQSIEYLSLRNIFNQNGIYRINILEKELQTSPPVISKCVLFICSNQIIQFILYIRIIFSLILLFSVSPVAIILLIISNLILAIRFKGAFNGGSDYMTLLTLIALFIASLAPENSKYSLMLMYLAIQVIMSYFLAGVAKLKDSDWRSGIAIANIINGPNYAPPIFIKKIFSLKLMSLFFGWVVIGFELLIPLIIFLPNQLGIIFLGLLIFHLINFLIFGLNRFFFAWLATYPAVFYFVTILPSIK